MPEHARVGRNPLSFTRKNAAQNPGRFSFRREVWCLCCVAFLLFLRGAGQCGVVGVAGRAPTVKSAWVRIVEWRVVA